MIDVFALGQCAYDRILAVPRAVGPDQKVEGTDLREQCGGPASSAAYALALWGRRCAFAGVIGDDPEGAAIRGDLERVGVDVRWLVPLAGVRSQQAFVAVEAGGGRRQILWQRPTAPLPALEALPRMRAFLTDGIHAEAALRIAASAPLVVVDAGTLRDETRALLDVADVFVGSEAFGRDLVGTEDPEAACRAIREHGAGLAGITLGADGYVALTDDGPIRAPAFATAAVDTTGCGDAFHAGLVEGLLRGWDAARSLRLGAWVAARVAETVGARAGLPADLGGFPS